MRKRNYMMVLVLAAGAFAVLAAGIGGHRSMVYSEKMGRGSREITIYDALKDSLVQTEKVNKTDRYWKRNLTPEQYRITTRKGTERPFTCELNNNKKEGIYSCVRCDTHLFRSENKFKSGTGWPSYFEPVSDLNVRLEKDTSHGMVRTEIRCARCGAHLGHVFNDGPPPTGKRYCINGVALQFTEAPEEHELATFAAGCFWGVEAAFRKLKGVVSTEVGYTGGIADNPSYYQVCAGDTGHAEAVRVKYDPGKISYEHLLRVFWEIHRPTSRAKQGVNNTGQYRSAVFYHSAAQKEKALEMKNELEEKGQWAGRPVVTQIAPADKFYRAEEYHQQYYEKQGGGSCPIP